MASSLNNYQCPACSGPLHYAEKSGKLECEYCGSSYEVAEIEKLYAEKEEAAVKEETREKTQEEIQEEQWNIASAGGEWGEEAEKLRAYSCPSCGAQIICDETTAATSCPYCGNPTVVPGKFGGTLRPDYIIPFKLTKEEAVKKLKEHYKGKLLLPKEFKDKNHIEEIKGVYVPFWLFDAKADADMVYSASNTDSRRDGDNLIVTTHHYDAFRKGNIVFEKVPVDGSRKMPNDFMDSIEPYDYKELKEFSTAYLPGFMANKYDVSAENASKRADKRCMETVLAEMKDTVCGYENVRVKDKNITFQKGDVKYALMPVWMLSTKWRDKNYLFAMNGQTGKMVGDLPSDKGRTKRFFWGSVAVFSLVFSLLFSTPIGRMISAWLM